MRRQSKRGLFLPAAFIVVAGILVAAMMIGFAAWGAGATTTAAATSSVNYNTVGSFGMEGYPALTIQPTKQTPSFITDALNAGRGVVILAYVQGAADDDEMYTNFQTVQSQYTGQADFFNFEAAEVSQFGDVLTQLGVNAPPVFAVIRSDGSVYQLYTGWISLQVMDQVVANALTTTDVSTDTTVQ
jgi:hypothetical protein